VFESLFLLAATSFAAAPATPADVPKVGELAPDFTMADQDGRFVTRDSLRGKTFVLGFYPKDFTGG
jgi:peroxiredoxin Q/BCP